VIKNIHRNSVRAHREERKTLGKRAAQILDFLRRDCGHYTDRELTAKLGYTDRMMVQPRVSDLIRDGHLQEIGSTRCRTTGKTVRLVAAVRGHRE
jgi:predicted transcriptional regulator